MPPHWIKSKLSGDDYWAFSMMIYTKNLEKVTLVMQMTKQTGTFIVGFVLWYSGSQLGDLRAQPGLKKHTSATQNFIYYYRLFLFLGFWLACKILDSFTFLGRKKLTNRTSWEGKERSRGIYGSEMFYQIWYRPVKKNARPDMIGLVLKNMDLIQRMQMTWTERNKNTDGSMISY